MPTWASRETAVAVGLLAVHAQVEPQRLGDLAADPHDRVERGHRVLEDHGDLGAPHVRAARSGTASSGPGPRSAPTRSGPRPSRGSRPMIERESTVLPEPDSPTMPSVLPRPRVNETPSTACTRPRGVWKEVRRSSTSSSGRSARSVRRSGCRRRPPASSGPGSQLALGTSKRWRSRSPMRLRANRKQNMASAGNRVSHGLMLQVCSHALVDACCPTTGWAGRPTGPGRPAIPPG